MSEHNADEQLETGWDNSTNGNRGGGTLPYTNLAGNEITVCIII